MRIPAIRLADAHATTSETYMYEFGWPSPQFSGRLGAVHGLEIPFVFDTLDPNLPLFGPLLGEDPPRQLADTMHAAWVSFAANGNPGWPTYDLDHRHDAFQHQLKGGGRSPILGTGPVGRRPLAQGEVTARLPCRRIGLAWGRRLD